MNARMSAAVAMTATLLVGCGAVADPVSGEATPTTQATTAPTVAPSSEPTTEEPPATEEPAATEEPSSEPAKDTTVIGKTLTYESGLAVRVVSAKVFKAGSYAVGLTAGHKAVKVTWTITNGTSANVDLAGAEARLTYGDDGVQAENVYTDGVGGQYPFEGSLQPGKRKTATTAFSVPKSGLAKISIEVEPEFMSETAFFTGKAT